MSSKWTQLSSPPKNIIFGKLLQLNDYQFIIVSQASISSHPYKDKEGIFKYNSITNLHQFFEK